MKQIEYNRKAAMEYAKKWAYLRNPLYPNFDPMGGDCTNFISQCLYEACKIMNYQKENGWYYESLQKRAPAWTGVKELYHFLIHNKGVGPYGEIVNINQVEEADIVQLAFQKEEFAHSILLVKVEGQKGNRTLEDLYGASHTFDSYQRKIATYPISQIRFIHIKGIRKW